MKRVTISKKKNEENWANLVFAFLTLSSVLASLAVMFYNF
jgi:hypothetical protein